MVALSTHLFLTVLEAEKSKIMVLVNLVSDEDLLPHSPLSSHGSLTGQRGKLAFWRLFYKGTNAIQEGSTLMT